MQRALSTSLLALASAGLLVSLSTVAGCSSSSGGGTTTPTDGGVDADATPWKGPDVEVTCTDTIASVSQAPTAALPTDKGAILRCARDADMAQEALQARVTALGYTGKAMTSGAHVYRVQFRTERGDKTHSASYSSAVLFVPDTPRAAKLPIVVASHGSRGQAGPCAIYARPHDQDQVWDDFERQVLPLVGGGYVVIAPDLAGYAGYGASGNPPSGYAASDDVARSTLDGARALKKLVPSILGDKVILTGHSQGGHTALSALAMAETYASELSIAGVVTYAPLWMPQRTWGTILLVPSVYPLNATYVSANAVSVWYHYTHGELLDGPGHGLDVFKASAKTAIKNWVDTQCWAGDGWTALEALGKDASDLFDSHFMDVIGDPAAGGSACPTTEPDKTTCETWMARYQADRPHLTGKAKTTPIVLFYGAKDTTIPPDRMTCAIDRLKKTDAAAVKICVDANALHGTIPALRAGWANDWIASLTLGGTAPSDADCGADETSLKDGSGTQIVCNTLPPND
jgi:pimeloyl-ACP methyl ester carboxylesterase